MRRISSVKSQEELQSDILCLKRQLALSLDENQLLKVKIRRLEDELRRKDKYIECAQTDPQKNRQFGRFVHEAAASLIYKLRRRNEELEDMLLERDSQENKRYKDFKTMCIYNSDFQSNRKGSKPLLQNVARLNSRLRSNAPSLKSLNKINTSGALDSMIRGRVRSSDSLHDVTARRDANNRYVPLGNAECPSLERCVEGDSEVCNVLETLELENIISDRLLRMKNAEICRLSAELENIRSRLRRQECERLEQSTSSTQLGETSQPQDHGTARARTNFVEENKRRVARSRIKHNSNRRGSATIEYPENKKLATLYEHTEETCSLDKSTDLPPNVPNNGNGRDMTVKTRPRTRIEYVDDSEVSSDGEEYTLPSNLTNFLEQAVNKGSSDDGTDANSD